MESCPFQYSLVLTVLLLIEDLQGNQKTCAPQITVSGIFKMGPNVVKKIWLGLGNFSQNVLTSTTHDVCTPGLPKALCNNQPFKTPSFPARYFSANTSTSEGLSQGCMAGLMESCALQSPLILTVLLPIEDLQGNQKTCAPQITLLTL